MQSVETFLPIFQGFYRTVFQYSNEDVEVEHFIDETGKDICSDDLNFDYKQYYKEIAKECCDYFESEFSDFVHKCEFQELVSPKFYNFSNDSVNCLITPNVNAIKKYLEEYSDEFSEYLKEKFTSYNGFYSFYSNDIDNWDIDKALEHKTQLGSILDFIAFNEDENYDLYMAESASGNVQMSVELTDEAKKKYGIANIA